MGMKKGASALWYSELSLRQLGSRPTVFMPRWTTHPCILYQVCATRGANELVPVDIGSKCAIHLDYLGVTRIQFLKLVCCKHGRIRHYSHVCRQSPAYLIVPAYYPLVQSSLLPSDGIASNFWHPSLHLNNHILWRITHNLQHACRPWDI